MLSIDNMSPSSNLKELSSPECHCCKLVEHGRVNFWVISCVRLALNFGIFRFFAWISFFGCQLVFVFIFSPKSPKAFSPSTIGRYSLKKKAIKSRQKDVHNFKKVKNNIIHKLTCRQYSEAVPQPAVG